ncbi:hypothetical protein TIFTF001_011590 [Ficus carica]|uniref:LOB domain-containing protein n=1 Tax=Ficus carica TaxID=3494 RepID=A0AA88A0Q1_FICCA|nr:hypothetical protein TIFTF001_011590 [Ficus carica]
MTIKGGTSQACAACKYQRRKCSKECPLAPFFPADQPEKFHYAHRLYGVRNIMSILKEVRNECKQDAMTSIIFESTMRARFPVHGCLGIINQLHTQLENTFEELHHVHTRLAICKQQEIGSSSHDSSLQLTMPSNYDVLTNGINGLYINPSTYDHGHLKSVMIENPSFNNVEPVAQSSFQEFPIPQELDVELDVSQYDDIPFDSIIDDRSQEAYDLSGEASFKNKFVETENKISNTDLTNSPASVSKTELTNAAASFSLKRGQL